MLGSMSGETSRDTIPRLHRIVPHVRDQLRGIADGASTFEACRVRYGETQRRLAQEGSGRLTAQPSGVSASERNWAPTRDCLSELMRLGALESKPLPSSRPFVDRYREEIYELTEYGNELAKSTSESVQFVDALTQRLIAVHPYFRALLFALEGNPIICPTIGEGEVERSRLGISGWARWAADRMGRDVLLGTVEDELASHLNRRFGNPPVERPSNKALAETTNDAFMVAAFTAHDIRIDAPTIKTLLRWGAELFLYDQSRYIPAYPDANVIWLAADLRRNGAGEILPTRRGISEYGNKVARAIPLAYWNQARDSKSSLVEPYLPVHQIRAQVAFECEVTRAMCDMVLSRLADGEYPEAGVSVLLHIGTTALPSSEPAFRHHGRRRLEVTMRNKQRRNS